MHLHQHTQEHASPLTLIHCTYKITGSKNNTHTQTYIVTYTHIYTHMHEHYSLIYFLLVKDALCRIIT